MDILPRFKLYLIDTKGVNNTTVKNYLSDCRHFFSWLTLKLAAENKIFLKKDHFLANFEQGVEFLTSQRFEEYKNYLLANNIAKSTINRRLATLRVFCQFCHNSGLLEQNPARNLTNLPVSQSTEKKIQDLVSKFGSWLKEQKQSKNTIKNYTADVQQYLLSQFKS